MNYLVVRLLNFFRNNQLLLHWVKSVRIRNNSGQYFPTILIRIFPHSGSASLRIRSECGKVRTMITPNTDTFSFILVCSNFYLIHNFFSYGMHTVASYKYARTNYSCRFHHYCMTFMNTEFVFF